MDGAPAVVSFADVGGSLPFACDINQKRLRLLEAKRLMLEEDETAERSAYRVGYKSASQFSREYSRMFGGAPIKDIVKMKLAKSRTGRD